MCTEVLLPLVPVTHTNSILLSKSLSFITSHKKFNSDKILSPYFL